MSLLLMRRRWLSNIQLQKTGAEAGSNGEILARF
jgi:hypothetical protein